MKLIPWMFAFAICLPIPAQLIDRTKATNYSGEGIAKSLKEQIGAGRGDWATPNSSLYVIHRDPFRAIRRGRQLFQHKFTRKEGQGPAYDDGAGNMNLTLAIGAGLTDSCAACHGRPRGSAGHGGNVVTRPDSRDAPHLFGVGLKEMLADEITAELRDRRNRAVARAKAAGSPVIVPLTSKGISYGSLAAAPDGRVDTSGVIGVDRDLRVRPFFAHGGTISLREFVIGAMQNEMGMQVVDAGVMKSSQGGVFVTPSGMVLDGALDSIEAPPTADPNADPDKDGVENELPEVLVDYLEFYLLNYFAPGTYEQTDATRNGRLLLERIGCTACHIADLQIDRDRRVASVETVYDPANARMNGLYATVAPLFSTTDDGIGHPALKLPTLQPFLVRNIFTDFKRHDLGPNFYERNYDGTIQKQFLTAALWGVGSTAPYGHDGRSVNLSEVILRHGGEAQAARDAYAALQPSERRDLIDFLNSMVLFPPEDTASNTDHGDAAAPNYPQSGHGSIRLTELFNNPSDPE